MAKMPAMQFYPGDWRKDLAVRSLGYHDRGVWIEMLCLMHESSERGVLLLNGTPMSDETISGILGLDIQIFIISLTKILANGVARRRQSDGAIYSKRMVEDERLCEVRRNAGKLGGNPVLLNQNPTTLDNQSPTPSSSSSSSITTIPIPLSIGKKKNAISLKTFIENCKVAGEKPIPDDDPVIDYAEKVGIPPDFLRLQWREFVDRYKDPDAKKYKLWRVVFRKSVRGCWFKLWYIDEKGQYVLTTIGVQAKKAHEGKAA
jgi:hypothetical protein